MLGVRKLVLIDEDRDELHNLDATFGLTPIGLGRPKVLNRMDVLKSMRPDDLEVEALPHSVLHPLAAEALRDVDLIVTCVDRDAPRLAAALAARRWCKVHLDIGTGIFGAGAARQLGGDVRLLLPGDACVVCVGGLRNLEEARYEVAAPVRALRRGQRRDWHEERAGSLVTMNQLAVNFGIQSWLDMLDGAVIRSLWCRLEWTSEGLPIVHFSRMTPTGCEICRGRTKRNEPTC
jgi:hypothetical protein